MQVPYRQQQHLLHVSWSAPCNAAGMQVVLHPPWLVVRGHAELLLAGMSLSTML